VDIGSEGHPSDIPPLAPQKMDIFLILFEILSPSRNGFPLM